MKSSTPTTPPSRFASWTHLSVTACLAVALFVQGRRISQLESARANPTEPPTETPAPEPEPGNSPVLAGHSPVSPRSSSEATSTGQNIEARFATLFRRVDQLADQVPASGRGPNVPEWDPSNPTEDYSIPEMPEVGATEFVSGWSALQVLGAPDTRLAADVNTAWASATPDGGAEWLRAGFRNPVEIAKVRVRESFNPGAIRRITATVDGVEVELWEGTAARARGMRDFVIRPVRGIVANQVTVHLDTSRVPGWNEIDAIEIVGTDGNRQWVTSAQASSEYGRRSETRTLLRGAGGGAALDTWSTGKPR